MRSHLCVIKPLFAAAGLLAALACGGELYLRIQETGREPTSSEVSFSTAGMTEPSRIVHHRLRPLSSFASRDPDTGEALEIRVNGHGLRGDETMVPKPPGVFRVLCLGGETVLGPEVSEAHTLPVRLQELLQARTRLRVEILNGGVPGDCPLLAWLRLRDSLLGLQPDLVLLHFDMSDVADDQRFRRHTRIGAGDVPIACHHPSIVTSVRARPWWSDLRLVKAAAGFAGGWTASGIADASAEIHDPRAETLWLRDNPPDWGVYVEQTLTPVESIRRTAEGPGGFFVLATCPQPWQVSAEASDGPGVRDAAGVARGAALTSRAPFEAVADFARKREIKFCDASSAFRDYPEAAKLFFRNSPQLSRYGQELYARVLSEFVAAQLPIFDEARNGPPSLELDEALEDPADERRNAVPTALHPWEPVRY